jgi:hypothetical protein
MLESELQSWTKLENGGGELGPLRGLGLANPLGGLAGWALLAVAEACLGFVLNEIQC